ncbi:MAG TPA: universal stress protein [Rhizomicrobium sp.]|nr:universal stress protein [Rhizomicrobium sp.]
MAYAKILAPLCGGPGDDVVLATAFLLAKPFNAHVEALFSYPDPRQAIPATDPIISPTIVQEIVDAVEAARKTASKAARAALAQAAGDAGVKIVSSPERGGMVTASYRELCGHLEETIPTAAQLADIVVFPPMTGDEEPDAHEAFVRTLTKSGRPVVLCAGRAPKTIGTKIAVGWDGRQAAANALAGAMPLLEAGGTVHIVAVTKAPYGGHTLAEARDYLALHGIRTTQAVVEDTKASPGELLLRTAKADGCDLLVCGGYGHSRTLETIFGGATAYLTSHADIPILMVH